MKPLYLKYSLMLCGLLSLTGCEVGTGTGGETANYSVGVGLGGTGTGTSGPSNPRPGEGLPTELGPDDNPYDVVYSSPVTQQCGDMKRTLQFLNYNYDIQQDGDRDELFSTTTLLEPTKFKLQIIVENTTNETRYEYLDSCKPLIRLNGSKTPKTIAHNFCLSEENVQVYQPHEVRTQNFIFNLTNLQQLWSLTYQAQYSDRFYNHPDQRTACDDLTIDLDIQPTIFGSDASEGPIFSPF